MLFHLFLGGAEGGLREMFMCYLHADSTRGSCHLEGILKLSLNLYFKMSPTTYEQLLENGSPGQHVGSWV